MARRRRRPSSRRRRAKGPVSKALRPYRKPLIAHSQGFTTASGALTQATIRGDDPFAQTPEKLAALASLAAWQRDVQRAHTRVQTVASRAAGRSLSARWLRTLSTSLRLLHQSLSSTDPAVAADLAKRARQSLKKAHALADKLDRTIA